MTDIKEIIQLSTTHEILVQKNIKGHLFPKSILRTPRPRCHLLQFPGQRPSDDPVRRSSDNKLSVPAKILCQFQLSQKHSRSYLWFSAAEVEAFDMFEEKGEERRSQGRQRKEIRNSLAIWQNGHQLKWSDPQRWSLVPRSGQGSRECRYFPLTLLQLSKLLPSTILQTYRRKTPQLSWRRKRHSTKKNPPFFSAFLFL